MAPEHGVQRRASGWAMLILLLCTELKVNAIKEIHISVTSLPKFIS